MFADSFCDSDWSNRSHRGWTTLISFSLQAIAVGCLLLLPLLYSQGLPRLVSFTPLLAPAPPPALHPAQPHADSHSGAQESTAGIELVSPAQIPSTVSMAPETALPAPMINSSGLDIGHGIGDRRGTVCWLGFWFRLGLASFAATGNAPSAAISDDGGKSHLSRSTGLPCSGETGAGAGTGGSASHDQPRRHDREFASAQRPSHAGAGCRGRRAAVAIPAIRTQWQASRSGNRS